MTSTRPLSSVSCASTAGQGFQAQHRGQPRHPRGTHLPASQLCVARVNNAFGSIDANQGDPNLGWDTDQFPTNVYETALCMLEVLKAGGFTNGGLNFDAKTRRGSYEPEDIFHAYIAGMDAFALGLRIADRLLTDGRLDAFVAERYASWKTGIGADVVAGKATMEQLEGLAPCSWATLPPTAAAGRNIWRTSSTP